MMFQIVKKPFQWIFGGIAILFLPMTMIMFLLTTDSYEEWKSNLKYFHLSFYS